MAHQSEESLRTLSLVDGRLGPDGWEVTEGYAGESTFSIDIRHALTSDHAFVFDNEDADKTRFLERCLSQREFRVIASRPPEIEHESLLRKLRACAQGFRWEHTEVATVARMLRNEGVLTDAEAEWLELAGPAWSEEDEPDE